MCVLCMCVYVCVSVCVMYECVCMYVCVYVCVCVSVCIYVCVMYECVCVCMCVPCKKVVERSVVIKTATGTLTPVWRYDLAVARAIGINITTS